MKTYTERKEAARQKAIEWSLTYSQKDLTWGEIAEIQEYFNTVGKRYELLTEFRENCIC